MKTILNTHHFITCCVHLHIDTNSISIYTPTGDMECKKQDAIPREKRKPQVLIAKAEAVTEAYTRVKQPSDARKENQQLMLTQTWSPPQNGYAKVNADAATNLKSNLVGLGAIIRDESWKVIAAAIKVSKFFGDVSFAEAE